MATLLFVYGTLKRGERNHHRLGAARFLRIARTLAKYRLYRIGWYPGLVVAADGSLIEGELWEVEVATLRDLDEYEGVPTWFDRREVEIEDEPGCVEAYFYQGEVGGRVDVGTTWNPAAGHEP